jgi:hypothetical protein
MQDDRWSGKNLEAVVAESRYYPRIYPERLSKTAEILRMADTPVEIRTEHLPNTTQ